MPLVLADAKGSVEILGHRANVPDGRVLARIRIQKPTSSASDLSLAKFDVDGGFPIRAIGVVQINRAVGRIRLVVANCQNLVVIVDVHLVAVEADMPTVSQR